MLEILQTKIFPKDKIISGVPKKNISNVEPLGFSITAALIYNDETIAKHRFTLCEQLEIPVSHFKIQKQIHSDIIRVIDSNSEVEESDAMITLTKGIILNVSIADCAAVLIYCKDIEAIAAIHSGWQGTKLKIVNKTIEKLHSEFKANPQDMLVYISPSAGGNSYEVEWDVASNFPNSIVQLSEKKYLFDNKNEIQIQLAESKINKNNIEVSPICTISDNNYHSYRRDKSNSGRMSAFIGMKL